MSSESQDYRRRPFSVNDLNRRTREVKIFNTTTITTTTASTAHDTASISNTTTVTNRGSGNTLRQQQTDNTDTRIPQINNPTVSSKKHDPRSKSAFVTSNEHYNYTQLPYTISTNSSITTPTKRKIRFVYGKEQQNIDPNTSRNNNINVEHYSNISQNLTSNLNDNTIYYNDTKTNDTFNENLPKFPYVRTSTSTEIPNAFIRNSVEINNKNLNDTYDNFDNVNIQDRQHHHQQQHQQDNNKELQIKDVEVECEIEEDPAIFEGSEGYVKNLISKIQTQYKNPETVHIKITRRQKPESIDKAGNLIKNSKESYGQIVRKEYYTIKSTNKPKKTSSISSFVDTSNIPFIDEEGDSKNNSTRNSKIEDNENRSPNYIIEKHVIYGDNKESENESNEIGVRDLVQSFGGVITNDQIAKVKDKKRAESFSPTRVKKASKKVPKSNLELNVDLKNQGENLEGEKKDGIKNFFKGIGGRIKAPDVHAPDVGLCGTDPKKDKSSTKSKSKKDKDQSPEKLKKDKDSKRKTSDKNKSDGQDTDIELRSPSIKTPKVDIDFQGPTVDVNVPSIKGPKVDADLHASSSKLPKVEVDVKGPSIKAPKVDVDLHGSSIKAPKMDVEIHGPSIKTPKVDIDVNAPTVDVPDVDINSPEFKGGLKGFFKGIGGKIKADVSAPEVGVRIPDIKEPKVKAPKVDLPGVNIDASLPVVDVDVHVSSVKVPKIDADLHASSSKLPKFEVDVQGPSIKAPKVDIDVHGPSIKAPKVDIDLNAQLDEPEIDVNSPEYKSGLKGFFKGIGGKIKAPEVSLPNVSLTSPDVKIKGPKVDFTDSNIDGTIQAPRGIVEIHGPALKKPQLDIDLHGPSVKTPKIDIDTHPSSLDVDVNGPSVELPEVDINSPEFKGGLKGFFKGIGGKIKAPDVSVPDVNITTPDIHSSKYKAPKVDLSGVNIETSLPVVDVDVHGPSVKGPKGDIDIKLPKVDADLRASSSKLPKVEVDFQAPSIKTPKVDIDINAQLDEPEIDVNSPEFKSGLKGFFKGIGGKIKAPEVDVSLASPDVNVSGKDTLPKFKQPKLDVDASFPKEDLDIYGSSIKAPKMDVEIHGPSIRGPKIDLDVQGPSIKTPKVDIDIQSPTVEEPEIDINSPEFKGGLKGFFKGIGGKIKAPEVTQPSININTPDVHKPKFKGPGFDFDATLPRVDVDLHGPSIKTPKIDIEPPKVKTPKIDIDFNLPSSDIPKVDLDVSLPSVDIPEVDINSPEYKSGLKGFFKGIGGKIKAPEVTLPDVHLPKFKAPKGELDLNVDPSLPKAKVDINVPSIKEPKLDADLHASSSKLPKFEVDVQGPSIKTPKVEVDVHGPSIKTPKIDLDLQAPEPEVDINSPEFKGGLKGFFKGIGGKIKAPEVSVPDVNVNKPDVSAVKFKGPKVDLPDINIDSTSPNFNVDINAPNVKPPKVDVDFQRPTIKQPKVDIDLHGSSTKSPKVDVDIHGPSIKAPKVDVDFKAPTIEEPDVDINSPEFKGGLKGFFKGIGGRIKAPEISLPDVSCPDVHLSKSKGPKTNLTDVDINASAKLPKSDVNLHAPTVKTPKVEIDIKGPKVDLKEPDFKLPELDIDAHTPSIKSPKIEVDIHHLTVDVQEVDINTPELKGGIKGFFKGIGGKIKAPEVSSSDASLTTDINLPKFKGPKVPEVNASLPKMDVDLHGPSIKAPKVDVDLHGPSIKGPKLDLELQGPSIKTPKVDIDLHGSSTKAPKVDVEIHGPSIKTPKVDIDIHSPTVEEPEIDINSPEFKGGLKGFFKGIGGKIKSDVSEPEVSNTTLDIHLPKFKAPEVSVDTKRASKVPKVDVDVHRPSVKAPKLDIDLHGPDIKAPKLDIDAYAPSLKSPKVEADLHGISVEEPEIDINSPEFKGGLKGFFKGIGGKIKAPEVSSSDNGLTADVHIPKFKVPNADLPDINIDADAVAPSAVVDVHGPSIKVPKVDIDLNASSVKDSKVDIDLQAPSVKAPKVDSSATVELHTPKIHTPSNDVAADLSSIDVKGGIKGFFKGLGGRIKAPDVQIPLTQPSIGDIKIKTDLPTVSVDITQEPATTHIDSSVHASSNREIVYGVDLPMTIVNNDWHWSSDSFKNNDSNRKVFVRSSVNSTDVTSTYINSGSFNLGNLNLIQNSDITSQVTKTVEVDHSILKTNNSGPVLEFELKRTTIKKDSQFISDNTTSTSSNKIPGDLNEAQLDGSNALSSITNNSVTLPKSKSSTGSFFRRKLSSASSASNIDLKKSIKSKHDLNASLNTTNNRSESADPTSRNKIDYSVPRECYVYTKPDFNGLGIHIACDKKSRRSPYIHDIEPNSPGVKSGLRKHDFILEINGEDAVNMEFTSLINKIQDSIKENKLRLTVGNEKAYKKWIKKSISTNQKSKS